MIPILTQILLAALLIVAIAYLVVLSKYLRHQISRKQPPSTKPPDVAQTILVKRTKASFRNPAKTHTTSFDEYKTSKGLYAPVRPGKGSTADDIDLSKNERR